VSEPSTKPEQFGCVACRAVPASWNELRLKFVRKLFEDSHEAYVLHACAECEQPFLYQFQEITWLPNGEDHIWLRWMPITEQELAEIDRLFPTPTEDDTNTHHLAKMMHRRVRLVRDPLGRFEWQDSPHDAGNLFPPG
jgi:hypothetical protein